MIQPLIPLPAIPPDQAICPHRLCIACGHRWTMRTQRDDPEQAPCPACGESSIPTHPEAP